MIFHDNVSQKLEELENTLPHGLIIYGRHGLGKHQAIRNLIKNRHPEAADLIDSHNWQHLVRIEPLEDKKSIGIAQIKSAEELLNLKDDNTRYVVIDQAELLTTEAQNAFLKTLEEPPENVHLILLTERLDSLLPTIRSRSQAVGFLPPTKDNFVQYLQSNNQLSEPKAERIYHITNGRIQYALELLKDDEKLSQIDTTLNDVKAFFAGSLDARVEVIKPYLKNRDTAIEFIEYLLTIARAGLHASETSPEKAVDWSQRSEKIIAADRRIKNHVQPRLVFAELMLKL